MPSAMNPKALGLAALLSVASCGGGSPAPQLPAPPPAPPPARGGIVHLFDTRLAAAELGVGAFPAALAEVLGAERVWIMDEVFVREQLKRVSRPGLTEHLVFRAKPRFPLDGRQRRTTLAGAALPDAGEWIDAERHLSQGSTKPGDVLLGPDAILVTLTPNAEPPEELHASYPVETSVLLSQVLSTPPVAGSPPAGRELTLRDETRRSLLAPLGTRLVWRLTLPAGAELRAAYGTRGLTLARAGPGVAVQRKSGAPATFAVEVREHGAEAWTTVWKRKSGRPEQFDELAVDLSDLAGRTVDLALSTLLDDDAAAQVFPFWAEPTLLGSAPVERPNIVVLLLDTLRADRLGCYGWERAQTPRLDALAERGVRYSNAWSAAPWTIPSHASLFTSTYVSEHGIWNRWQRIPDSLETVAEVLRSNGYHTAAFTGGGFVRAQYGLAQGFDVFLTTPSDDATVGFDRAWEWMRSAGRPFFCFVHTYQVHSPYAPPPDERERLVRSYDGELPADVHPPDHPWGRNRENELSAADVRYLEDLYDAEIAALDGTVGVLLDRLESAGRLDDTLLVVTSDHGEEFNDHGHFDHGMSLYEEQLAVPLLVYQRATFEGGRVVEHPVHGVDLAPTLVRSAGATLPAEWSGVPLSLEPPAAGRPLFVPFLTRSDGMAAYALRLGEHKYIDFPHDRRPCDVLAGPKLFDLSADPDERENLWSADTSERWAEAVRQLETRYPLRAATEAVDADDALTSELRALGYLGDE